MNPWKRKEVIGNAGGVYQILNVKNGKKYIGSAVNFRSRWNQHKSDLSLGRSKCQKLQAAWNKHGPSVFTFSVLEIVEERALLTAREQEWIDRLGVVNYGYNICPTAGNQLGLKHSDESRRKMSEFHANRVRKPCSEETKKKIGDAHRGKPKPPCTPEYREHMSLAMRGRKKPPRTPDQCARYALAQTGKHASPETRAKMVSAQTKRWERIHGI